MCGQLHPCVFCVPFSTKWGLRLHPDLFPPRKIPAVKNPKPFSTTLPVENSSPTTLRQFFGGAAFCHCMFGCSFCPCSCLYSTNKSHLPESEYSRRSCTPRGCSFVWLGRKGKRVENEQLLLCLFKKSLGFVLTFLQLGEGLGQGQCIFHWDLVDQQRGEP